MNCNAHPEVKQLLEELYFDAAQTDPLVFQAAREAKAAHHDHHHHRHHHHDKHSFRATRHAYMPIGRDFGNLLYALIRSSNAKTVVEFGTSFGISTIYLASAIRDNGGEGKVITTEYEPEKAERAKKNLTTAGLEKFVEFRVGDALETLKTDFPGGVDLLFLDGAKELYLDVLKLVEPHLRRGGIVASDNTDHEGAGPFLRYVRSPENGYTSSAIVTTDHRKSGGHEISVRNLLGQG